MPIDNLRFVGGIDAGLVLRARAAGRQEIRVRQGRASISPVGAIICSRLGKRAAETVRRRRIRRRLPAIFLSLLLAPFLPLCVYGTELTMLAMTFGRPLEQQKRQEF